MKQLRQFGLGSALVKLCLSLGRGVPERYELRTRPLTEDGAWRLIGEPPEGVARYVAFVCATTARDPPRHGRVRLVPRRL